MRTRKTADRSQAPFAQLVGGAFAGVPISGTDGRLSVLPLDVGETLIGAGPGRPPVAGLTQAYPVGSIFSAAVSTYPGDMLGYGTWQLFATGEGAIGNPIVITRV